ncbi:tyrosine-type recombinase/integrase [Asticcacaulis taihuensis]|uniref:tyrosine-type recombinase/integrase n=1 Tax=Asticcacaulis taihuensis TaxID=260084 RepID=UPI0026EC6EEF|nr:tyrosine-type recombinase/integrase [Asticcacaulis taihuensis]
MGTVHPRKRKDGTTSYQAQVFIRRSGKIVHREVRTFDRKQAASAWLEAREKELSTPAGLALAHHKDPVLSDIIDRYVDESLKVIRKTKAQVLRSIKSFDLAEMNASEVTSEDIVAFAKELTKTRSPQTAGNYLSHLAAIFAIARPAWGYKLNEQAMKDAVTVCKRLGLISKSRERDRRPSLEELDTLMSHYRDRETRTNSIPMSKIVPFAMFSTRRQEEIIRIKWSDLDERNSRVLVRDMKNPGEKVGNDVWCDLPPEALAVALSMPRVADEIFPYSVHAITAQFTRACKLLDIDDLHFHDLRHDGISRLFELGNSIPKTACVSGHKTWNSLKRYTHIREWGDKYKDWKWFGVAYARYSTEMPSGKTRVSTRAMPRKR